MNTEPEDNIHGEDLLEEIRQQISYGDQPSLLEKMFQMPEIEYEPSDLERYLKCDSQLQHLIYLLMGYRSYIVAAECPYSRGSARESSWSTGWKMAEKDMKELQWGMKVVRCHNIDCKHNGLQEADHGFCNRTDLTIVGFNSECSDSEDVEDAQQRRFRRAFDRLHAKHERHDPSVNPCPCGTQRICPEDCEARVAHTEWKWEQEHA